MSAVILDEDDDYRGAMGESGMSLAQQESNQDEELTETLVPSPVDHTPSAGVTLEERLRNAREHRSHTSGSNIELRQDSRLRQQLSGAKEKEQSPKRNQSSRLSISSGKSTPGDGQVEPKETNGPLLSSTVTTLYSLGHLIFFSILGTLARLGLKAITIYPNAPFTSPVLWANLGGTFFLGFLLEDRRVFREEWGVFVSPGDWSFHPEVIESADAGMIQYAHENHSRVKKTIPLFVGLATGFCGSFTSFSSLIRDAFLALSNGLSPLPPNEPPIVSRNGGYSFEAFIAIIVVQVAVSMSALKVGAHVALALDGLTPTIPFKIIRSVVDPCVVFLGFGSWIGAIFLSAFPPHREWRGRVTLALVFAPLGCLFRFYISKYLNSRIDSFPLGTFVANTTGTILLGLCFDLQHSTSIAEEFISCQVLEGLMEGFSGCATTVSTWISELNGLKRRHGYIYGFTSVAVALSFLIVIMGSLQWSRGFQIPSCI